MTQGSRPPGRDRDVPGDCLKTRTNGTHRRTFVAAEWPIPGQLFFVPTDVSLIICRRAARAAARSASSSSTCVVSAWFADRVSPLRRLGSERQNTSCGSPTCWTPAASSKAASRRCGEAGPTCSRTWPGYVNSCVSDHRIQRAHDPALGQGSHPRAYCAPKAGRCV
jgi:hypothetical protein